MTISPDPPLLFDGVFRALATLEGHSQRSLARL